MPVLWRFFLKHYLKVLGLALFAIVSVLMVTRLDEVAEFAILGAKKGAIIAYTLYQVPYIFPIALPIACVLSSMILFQRLSFTHEITAIRMAGLGFLQVLAPVIIASLFLSLFDFWVVSDFTTSCRLKARQMELALRTINPTALLKHRRLLKFTNAFGEVLGEFDEDSKATDVILAMHHQKHGRTQLVAVSSLEGSTTLVEAQNATIIHSIPSKQEEQFDNLLV